MVRPHAEGCVVSVWAQPGAKADAVVGERRGMLHIAVTAPPEDGRANRAIADVLRDRLKLKRSQVELLTGATHREKAFLLRGVDAATVSISLALM